MSVWITVYKHKKCYNYGKLRENYYNLLWFIFVTEAERCLEFQFVFFRPSERNKYSEVRVEYPDPDTNDWEVLGSFSGDDKDKTTAALTLPAIQNLQVWSV